MGGAWLEGLTITDLERIAKIFADNYPCRLAAFYIFQPPKSIEKLYRLTEPYLSQTMLNKIIVENGTVPEHLLSNAASGQVEARYGGKAADVTTAWPPVMPPGLVTAPHILQKSFDDISVPELNESSFMQTSMSKPFANLDLLVSDSVAQSFSVEPSRSDIAPGTDLEARLPTKTPRTNR